MDTQKIDLSQYKNSLSRKNRLLRMVWNIVWCLCASWMPRWFGNRWRLFLLRLFGANIAKTAGVHPSAKIYYPPFLTMGEYSCLASGVDCYNVAPVILGNNATVSQGAYLCTASHDISDPANHLITAPIVIEDCAWVAARAYVGMGVTIHEGAVVGATASVYKDVDAWTVVGGNPAKVLKIRDLSRGGVR